MQPRWRIHRHQPILDTYKILLCSLIERVLDFENLNVSVFDQLIAYALPLGGRLVVVMPAIMFAQAQYRLGDALVGVVKQAHKSVWVW